MSDLAFLLLAASPLTWLWVAYDVNRPRYYADDGSVHRTARAAEDASRAVAPASGMAMVEELRKERDDAAERIQGTSLLADEYQDARDRLAALPAKEGE